MVGLVVDDIDAVVVEQLLASPFQHVRIGFRRLDRGGIVALEEAARGFGQYERLAVLEGVVAAADDVHAAAEKLVRHGR